MLRSCHNLALDALPTVIGMRGRKLSPATRPEAFDHMGCMIDPSSVEEGAIIICLTSHPQSPADGRRETGLHENPKSRHVLKPAPAHRQK